MKSWLSVVALVVTLGGNGANALAQTAPPTASSDLPHGNLDYANTRAASMAPNVAVAQSSGVAVPPPSNVPAALQVPDGNVLLFRGFAAGTQVYDCVAVGSATGAPAWVFRQPKAMLVGDDGEPLGVHGLGPFWASFDGSRVVGSAPVSAPGRDPTQDVPLLLLQGTPADGEGQFATVTFIQRLETRGGAAPPGACDPVQEPSVSVPYEAVYYFYGPQPTAS